jgi:hypothetical protein
MTTRKACTVDGCHRMGRNKGRDEFGKPKWGQRCQFHQKALDGLPIGGRDHANVPNRKCEACGWDKAPCDRHRLNPALGYTRANVKVLCPNCHRLATLGILQAEEAESRS